MEAARVLKERGHNVSLYEKADKLGGLWNIVVQDPKKANFADVTNYLRRGLQKAGVPVFVNKGGHARACKKGEARRSRGGHRSYPEKH